MRRELLEGKNQKVGEEQNLLCKVYLQLELHPIPELNWGKWGMGRNSDQLGRQIFREEMQTEERLSIDAKHVCR